MSREHLVAFFLRTFPFHTYAVARIHLTDVKMARKGGEIAALKQAEQEAAQLINGAREGRFRSWMSLQAFLLTNGVCFMQSANQR